MKGKYHLIISFIFFIVLWLLIPKINVTDIIFPIFVTIFPDVDLKFKKILGHRSIWTHSIILPLIVFIFTPEILQVLILIAIGLHLLCDIKFTKMQGYATLIILNVYITPKIRFPRYRLTGKQSNLWLLGNFIMAMIILIIWCLI